ncbi:MULTISPECIES: ParB/RepB/Spo0J family partition protein [Treponema]|uniref:ParB-like partition protein n=1 Tax=Treponema succinifaciens (strain ATCC 33096 / DSM 2489 / 6091) TaxID=869209 RepID=F2NW76_TRES6|nr:MULTISPECIES: ParB/RepB/Spo0J family partition protein [Treponema]AEB14931.1 parB-like partition protein [Treponema succinifaciens DSM 2489]MCI6913608.1 ParB/RepB/Spo0J family partition protein [Treponema succinifaciens]MDY2615334.1 ParB/RepB/Spo0J family partition protein [Treponema succinifaciens]UKI56217.1 MAG: ParB/RepB/Spo0J family partition protein [Treponema succinifaciens]
MAKHQGLGKGLGALMQEADLSEEISENGVQLKENASPVNLNLPTGISSDENGTLWVDPALLKPNPRQPRTYFDDEKLAELTESVRNEGILSPVIIEDANDGTFFIIAGERRTRAAKAAGLKKIPVQLRKYSEQRKLEVALIENIQRTDLNALEEAQAYYDLMELGNLTQDQVAERVGKNRSTVANCLRLLKLPEDIQKALVTDSISSGHARAILSLENDSDKRILFGKIIGQGLSVRQSENIAKEMKSGISSVAKTDLKPEPKKDPNLAALEQKLIERLGTKVQLKGGFSKGTISINYFSSEDLDRIFNLIVPDANL